MAALGQDGSLFLPIPRLPDYSRFQPLLHGRPSPCARWGEGHRNAGLITGQYLAWLTQNHFGQWGTLSTSPSTSCYWRHIFSFYASIFILFSTRARRQVPLGRSSHSPSCCTSPRPVSMASPLSCDLSVASMDPEPQPHISYAEVSLHLCLCLLVSVSLSVSVCSSSVSLSVSVCLSVCLSLSSLLEAFILAPNLTALWQKQEEQWLPWVHSGKKGCFQNKFLRHHLNKTTQTRVASLKGSGVKAGPDS